MDIRAGPPAPEMLTFTNISVLGFRFFQVFAPVRQAPYIADNFGNMASCPDGGQLPARSAAPGWACGGVLLFGASPLSTAPQNASQRGDCSGRYIQCVHPTARQIGRYLVSIRTTHSLKIIFISSVFLYLRQIFYGGSCFFGSFAIQLGKGDCHTLIQIVIN